MFLYVLDNWHVKYYHNKNIIPGTMVFIVPFPTKAGGLLSWQTF